MKVNEIFYSIQGESTYAGRPCIFVRLTGCNLRCTYCDTQYAYEEGVELKVKDIFKSISSYECALVEVTGGEPLVQKETPSLINDLLEKGYEVLLETNGSLDIGQIDERCIKIVDIKCPSSGEEEKNDFGNLGKLTEKDEIKFIIGTWEDYEYAKKVLERINHKRHRKNPVHLSPVYGKMSPEILAEWILKDRLDVRLNLQLQKIIWGPKKRGV